MRRAVWLVGLTVGLLLFAERPAAAEDRVQRVTIPGEVAGTSRRLQGVRTLAEERAKRAAPQSTAGWLPVIEEYERIIHEVGDDLVGVDAEQSVPARYLCHLDVSRLPAAALQLYRDRLELKARPLLEQAVANRDETLLRQLVNDAFCSRQASTALDLLGDLAFERGDFDAAERWWRSLARPLDEREDSNRLVYPHPAEGLAAPRAKQLLARLFRGEAARLEPDLALFRQHHADATGRLAGKDGKYADILTSLAAHAGELSIRDVDENWPTFAGSPSRQRILPSHPRDPDRLSWLLRDDPICFDLARHLRTEKPHEEPKPGPVLTPTAEARSFAFFPIVIQNRIVVSDGRSVTVYDPVSGRTHTWEPEQANIQDLVAVDNKLPAAPDVRHTLTGSGDRVFVRLGPASAETKGAKNVLVCLRLRSDGKLEHVWHLRPPIESDGGIRIESSPLIHDGRLYLAVTRISGGQLITTVHCYAADTTRPPGPRWRQDVCSTPDRSNDARFRQHLLTIAGGNLVYCSETGAIVALDATTGKRMWARKYHAQAANPNSNPPAPRDLVPCLYADGRLYAAPADADSLFCLDSDTGRTLWDRDHLEVVQLYGVAQGRLIFTTPHGIRAVDASDGLDARGWFQPGDGTTLSSLGRGFLAGELVYWPTRAGLCVLDQSDGEQPYGVNPVPIRDRCPRGNMLFANGMFVVAGAKEMYVFLPPSQKLEEKQPAVKNGAETRLAAYRATANDPEKALSAWHSLLHDDALRKALIPLRSGSVQSAGLMARTEVARLLALGAAAESAKRIDEESRAYLAEARKSKDESRLASVAETYPNFAAGKEALTDLIAACEATARSAAAEHWRRQKAKLFGAAAATETVPPRRSPQPAASLDGPLVRLWELKLDPDERFLPLVNEQTTAAPLFFARGNRVRCMDVRTGNERWRVEMPDSPRWAAYHAGSVLLGSPAEVCSLCLDNGRVFWRFPPDLKQNENEEARRPMTAFRLTSDSLFCIEDQRRLFALDPDTGEVQWARWAPGATLYVVKGARFLPQWDADEDSVLLQSASGESRLLDADTGTVRRRGTATGAWLQPVMHIDEHRSVLVWDARRIVAVDRRTGNEVWTFVPERPTNLSGEPPRLIASVDAILLVIARNHGYFLQRLDPATGRAMWYAEAPLGPHAVDPARIAIRDTAVHIAGNGTLSCRDLATGRRRWQQPLNSPGAWHVAATPDGLLLHPLKPDDNPRTDDFPIELRDPASGALTQRLHFRAAVRFQPLNFQLSANKFELPRARVQSISWPQVFPAAHGVTVVVSETAIRLGHRE